MTNKTTRLRLYTILAVMLLTVSLLPTISFAEPSLPEIQLAAKAGYGNAGLVGAANPFTITLSNNGEDFTGEVQVIIKTTDITESMYAAPVTLPKGSRKEIKLDIPIFTIDRKIDIRLVKGKKIINKGKCEFNKLISPESPVIGILCDDANGLRSLNGLKITAGGGGIASQGVYYQYPGGTSYIKSSPAIGPAQADIPAELISLDSKTLPDELKALEGFKILVISNYDTSSLSDKQKKAIGTWVSRGGRLYIGTGTNWKKVYSGLDSQLKPFEISGTDKSQFPETLEKYTEKSVPSSGIDIATGSINEGSTIIEDKDIPLAIKYRIGSGAVIVLTFDPTLEPMVGWNGTPLMWKRLLSEQSYRMGQQMNYYGGSSYYSPYYGGMPDDINQIAGSVPENQTPPINRILILIGVYILIVGPLLYLVLKWRDKRDWSWVIVPAAAFLFLGIIYVAGFKTRFSSAVLNNISFININDNQKIADVRTIMGVFNNKRSKMTMEYSSDIQIQTESSFGYYGHYGYSYSMNGSPEKPVLVSKYTMADPVSYEVYNVPMWSSRVLQANKTIPIKSGLVKSVVINDGTLKLTLNNSLSSDLKDAFIAYGNSFIELGDIPSGRETQLEINLWDTAKYLTVQEFFEKRFNIPGAVQGQKVPTKKLATYRDNFRKQAVINYAMQNLHSNTTGKLNITLFAFNYSNLEYDVKINGGKPKTYNTNLVYENVDYNYQKGSNITIPPGTVKSEFIRTDSNMGKIEEINTPVGFGLRVLDLNQEFNMDFNFAVPEYISPEKFRIKWSTFLMSDAYQFGQKTNQSSQNTPSNTYIYYIYNNSTSKWDEADKDQQFDSKTSSYISNEGIIKVRAAVTPVWQEEILKIPEIELSGVVK